MRLAVRAFRRFLAPSPSSAPRREGWGRFLAPSPSGTPGGEGWGEGGQHPSRVSEFPSGAVARLVLLTLFALATFNTCHAQTAATDDITFGATDWPWWRGPDRNGLADPKQKIPLQWSATENIVWKAAVPGRGHGSPIVVGDQVVLATADDETQVQSLLCFERGTGKLLWQTEIHKGGFVKGGNGKSSHASSTPACDGHRFFVNFLNGNAIHTTALTRDGKILWQKKVADYVLHQGFGSSPAVYESLVIVSADNKGGKGAIAALDRATGEVKWRHDRPATPNYCSPIILKTAGKVQLIMIGCDLVASFEPLTGKKLWEIKGATTECVTSTVTDGNLIYTSGGFPKSHVAAVKADGSGETVWQNTLRIYVPSFLSHKGYLYGVLDAGLAVCWKADDGKEMWKERLDGNFSGSPVLVGDHLVAANELGRTYIWKASPEAFTLVAHNQLGDEVMATPTICGDRIYLRVATKEKGKRSETLYCVGPRVSRYNPHIMAVLSYVLGGDFPTACMRGALTLGNFDGVHRGHQALLAETVRQARQLGGPAVAVTFDPPPTQVLRPEVYQPLLTPIDQKARLIQQHFIDHVLVLQTSRELLGLEAEAFFERIIHNGLKAQALIEGYNFAFGGGRRGTVEVLERLGKEQGIAVTLLPPQEVLGAPVSSSRVRGELLAGHVEAVRDMLARPYSLAGTVGEGQKRGRTLGFPTANLEAVENLVPGNGVYAVRVGHAGALHAGAANIGPNPTFAENARKVEVHLLDFAGDLYGHRLEVDFHAKIRDTRPFASPEELVRQIQADVRRVREIMRT